MVHTILCRLVQINFCAPISLHPSRDYQATLLVRGLSIYNPEIAKFPVRPLVFFYGEQGTSAWVPPHHLHYIKALHRL